MATTPDKKEALKLARMVKKEAKAARDHQLLIAILTSPVFQMTGTIAIAEILEKLGLLSSAWAGALEGGVIAMTGLQAVEKAGVVGAMALTGGLAGGAITGGLSNVPVIGDFSKSLFEPWTQFK